MDDESLTLEWARTLMPARQGAKLERDDVLHFRWIAKYPTPQRPHMRSAVWNEDRSGIEALKDVLTWAWDEHFKLTGEKCMFRLEELPAIVPFIVVVL
jgi:hypothetical protein